MLEPEADVYLPHDLKCGETLDVYGRKLFLYDCDPFTRVFYEQWHGFTQPHFEIPDPPERKIEILVPPHNGIGTEEDSLGSVYALWPKPPKKDQVQLMTQSSIIIFFFLTVLIIFFIVNI